jgi:transketolase N-terminal domain/subunit
MNLEQISKEIRKSILHMNARSSASHSGTALSTVNICRLSTDWISYNYLKAHYLLAGCKREIITLSVSDQESR